MNIDDENKMELNSSYTERTSIAFEELLHQINNVIAEGFLWARRHGIRYDGKILYHYYCCFTINTQRSLFDIF